MPKLTHCKAKAPASSVAQISGFASESSEICKTNWRSNSFLQLALEQAQSTRKQHPGFGEMVATQDNFQATAQTIEQQNSPMRRTQPHGIQQEMKVIFIIEYSFLQLPEQRICKISKKTINLTLFFKTLVTLLFMLYRKPWVENWGRQTQSHHYPAKKRKAFMLDEHTKAGWWK